MAHRLPPAGTKTKKSDFFAFNLVRSAEDTKEKPQCTQRSIVLPITISGSDYRGEQDGFKICCRSDDVDRIIPERCSPGAKVPNYEIILVNPPGEKDDKKNSSRSDEPGRCIPNMRKREITTHPELLGSPTFIEFVEDPAEVVARIAEPQSNSAETSKDSIDVNVGSERQYYTIERQPSRDNGFDSCNA